MFTFLAALVPGLLTGIFPTVVKRWADWGQAADERKFLELQHKWEMERINANADMKLREIESGQIAEEMRATREHLTAIIEAQSRPVGILWIDAFNALVRPVVASGIAVLFFWIAYVYVGTVVHQYLAGHMDAATFSQAIFGSLIGDTIIGVWGFLFGYGGARNAIKSGG